MLESGSRDRAQVGLEVSNVPRRSSCLSMMDQSGACSGQGSPIVDANRGGSSGCISQAPISSYDYFLTRPVIGGVVEILRRNLAYSTEIKCHKVRSFRVETGNFEYRKVGVELGSGRRSDLVPEIGELHLIFVFK